MAQPEWITVAAAAAIIGCPVTTVPHYVRTGRISRRSVRVACLNRASVVEFANWWHNEEADHDSAADRQTRSNSPSRTRAGWLSSASAAAVLEVDPGHVAWLAEHGRFTGEKRRGYWQFDEAEVRAYAEERGAWVSHVQAAKLVGCDHRTIERAVKAGRIKRREVHRSRPSLLRRSVVAFAAEFRTTQANWKRRQAAHAARTLRLAEERRARQGPPQDEHVWLDTTTTALVLGVRPARVQRLAAEERLPSVKVGTRRWYRRDHIEQLAAAFAISA